MALEIIGKEWIEQYIVEEQGLEAVKIAFESLGNDALTQPPVMQLAFPEHKGETCIKSAHLHGRTIACVKVASGFYDNPKKGLPSGSGLMLLLDATTGFPLAMLQDGGYLTDVRTAAAGALAADLFCPKALGKVAIIGSGIQARFQLKAVSKIRQVSQVSAYSPNSDNLNKYCTEMAAELKCSVTAEPSAEACVRGADLVITTTPSNTPIVQASWVKKGATIIAMGSDTPGKQELHTDVLELAKENGKIICDKVSQCTRLGEVQHLQSGADYVHGELGQVLIGKVTGRENADEVIVVDLTGCGAQDAAIAEATYNTYKKSADERKN